MRNPIHDTAWASLKNLSADLVRFVPWYPYPRRSVAELLPPVPGKPTSWNFTLLIPQLEDFFRATADQGHETIVNFATQPVRPSSILAAASQVSRAWTCAVLVVQQELDDVHTPIEPRRGGFQLYVPHLSLRLWKPQRAAAQTPLASPPTTSSTQRASS